MPREDYVAQNSWLDGQFYDAQIAGPLFAGMSLAGSFSLSLPERFDEIESVGFRLRTREIAFARLGFEANLGVCQS